MFEATVAAWHTLYERYSKALVVVACRGHVCEGLHVERRRYLAGPRLDARPAHRRGAAVLPVCSLSGSSPVRCKAFRLRALQPSACCIHVSKPLELSYPHRLHQGQGSSKYAVRKQCKLVSDAVVAHDRLTGDRWLFNDEAAAAVVAGPPLFLGSLPARQPEQFYALLPFRPASLAKVRSNIA